MNKNKTHKYKPSKNNKSKRNQGGIGSPKIEKNVSFSIGPTTVYLG